MTRRQQAYRWQPRRRAAWRIAADIGLGALIVAGFAAGMLFLLTR